MERWEGCYHGKENHAAKKATLLAQVSQEARALCPRRNAAWRIVYFDGDTVYYCLGACPRFQCDLAGLIEQRLCAVYHREIRMERVQEVISVQIPVPGR